MATEPLNLEALRQAVRYVESRGNPNAVSPKGALGEMQVMPATLVDPGYGVRPAKDRSPAELKRVGDDYLEAMVKAHGSLPEALAAYNWGPGNLRKKGLEAAPGETQTYIQRVLDMLPGKVPAPVAAAPSPLGAIAGVEPTLPAARPELTGWPPVNATAMAAALTTPPASVVPAASTSLPDLMVWMRPPARPEVDVGALLKQANPPSAILDLAELFEALKRRTLSLR